LEEILQSLRMFFVCYRRVVEFSKAHDCRAAAVVNPGYLAVEETAPEVAENVISFHVVDHLLELLRPES